MKQHYEAPKIVDERFCEAEAAACGKIPGNGDDKFCDTVWVSSSGIGNSPPCSMNPTSVSRSS